MMIRFMVVAAAIVEIVRTPDAADSVVVGSVVPKERRTIVTTADASGIVDIGGVGGVIVTAATVVAVIVH
jgi:hypothetical protein